jgi:hypothetical protein
MGIDICVNGLLPKLTSAAKRAVLALALQPDLAVINTENFCGDYDPDWAKATAGIKNVPKKFSQAMVALQRHIPGIRHESLGRGSARVGGILFGPRPPAAKLKKQISFLLNP